MSTSRPFLVLMKIVRGNMPSGTTILGCLTETRSPSARRKGQPKHALQIEDGKMTTNDLIEHKMMCARSRWGEICYVLPQMFWRLESLDYEYHTDSKAQSRLGSESARL